MARRIVFALILSMTLVGLFVQPLPAKAAGTSLDGFEPTRDTPYVPGEVVVVFAGLPGAAQTGAQAQALADEVGAMVEQQAAGIALLSVDPSTDVEALSEQVKGYSGVANAAPNYISWIPESDPQSHPYQMTEVTRTNEAGETQTISIDDLAKMKSIVKGQAVATYSNDGWNNWGYSRMQAPIIWIESKPSPEVCVIDSGADVDHPDLKGNMLNGYDYVNNDNIANDDNGHGTHVAGVIAARSNNGIGIAGISNGKVVAVKVLTSEGWGTSYNIWQGIMFCANRSSTKVINMSLGSYSNDSNEYNALNYAINTKGKLVVAAAGNDTTNARFYPAAWADDGTIGPGLVSVGAAVPGGTWIDIDSDGVKDPGETFSDCAASFSNYGTWVSVVAPGVSIYSTLPVSYPFTLNYYEGFYSGYDYLDGTSMASPQVAAAAARLWSLHNSGTNNWTPSQIKSWLVYTGDDVYTNASGGGAGDRTWCWQSSMSGARYVNVATAMMRGAIQAEAVDSTTGLPLTGATVYALKQGTTSTVNSALVARNDYRWVDLINLPVWNLDATGHATSPSYYDLGVNKSGYTSGTVKYYYNLFPPWGHYGWFAGSMAAVPPNKGFGVVLNWEPTYSGNLDLYLWMPYANPHTVVGISNWGDLSVSPFARWYHNGGSGEYNVGVETILVKNTGSVPYYPGHHDILVYDVNTYGHNLNHSNARLRVWYGGTIKLSIGIIGSCSNETSQDWWFVGTFLKNGSSTSYYYTETCGSYGSVAPWATSQTISTIDKK